MFYYTYEVISKSTFLHSLPQYQNSLFILLFYNLLDADGIAFFVHEHALSCQNPARQLINPFARGVESGTGLAETSIPFGPIAGIKNPREMFIDYKLQNPIPKKFRSARQHQGFPQFPGMPNFADMAAMVNDMANRMENRANRDNMDGMDDMPNMPNCGPY